MDNQWSGPRLRRVAIRYVAAGALLVAGGVFAVDYAIKEHRRAAQAGAKERMRQQIDDFRSGNQTSILLTNESDDYQFPAFIEAQGDLGQAQPYALHVMYSHDVDAFLSQLAGIRGLQSLGLYKTDVSDAGIEFVATMPELRAVTIGRNLKTAVTDEKLAQLRARLPQCTFKIGDDQ